MFRTVVAACCAVSVIHLGLFLQHLQWNLLFFIKYSRLLLCPIICLSLATTRVKLSTSRGREKRPVSPSPKARNTVRDSSFVTLCAYKWLFREKCAARSLSNNAGLSCSWNFPKILLWKSQPEPVCNILPGEWNRWRAAPSVVHVNTLQWWQTLLTPGASSPPPRTSTSWRWTRSDIDSALCGVTAIDYANGNMQLCSIVLSHSRWCDSLWRDNLPAQRLLLSWFIVCVCLVVCGVFLLWKTCMCAVISVISTLWLYWSWLTGDSFLDWHSIVKFAALSRDFIPKSKHRLKLTSPKLLLNTVFILSVVFFAVC